MHFVSDEEKEKLIEDYVEIITAMAFKRVEDAEAAIREEQEDTKTAENTGLTTRESQKNLHEKRVAIGDSVSNIASSDDGEDREDVVDEETEQGKLSEDDEPGGVMRTISETVQQRIERFLEKQMKIDEVSKLGWEDAANKFQEEIRSPEYPNWRLRQSLNRERIMM